MRKRLFQEKCVPKTQKSSGNDASVSKVAVGKARKVQNPRVDDPFGQSRDFGLARNARKGIFKGGECK